jgi:hypothetical protein
MKKFLSSLVLAVFLLSQTQPAMANAYSTPGAFSGIGSDVRAEYFNGKHDPQLSPRIKIEKIYGDKLRGEGKVFCTLFKNRKDGKRYFAVAASSSVIKSGNKLEDSRRRFGRLKWSVAAKSPGKSYDVLRIDYPKKFTAPFIGTGDVYRTRATDPEITLFDGDVRTAYYGMEDLFFFSTGFDNGDPPQRYEGIYSAGIQCGLLELDEQTDTDFSTLLQRFFEGIGNIPFVIIEKVTEKLRESY